MVLLKRIALALALASSALAQDGGIEIFAGETIFTSGTRISITEIFKSKEGLIAGSSDITDPLDRRFEEMRTVVGINHGFARAWSFSALLPLVDRSLDTNVGGVSNSGLGDLSLILKHRFQRLDWFRSAWHSAWIFGVEVPSGETGAKDGGTRLSPSLQAGSGSWDPFLGLATTLSLDRWRFDFQTLFKANGEGSQSFEESDKLTVALSGKYRFIHEAYPGPSASATMGLKWGHSWHAEDHGVSVDNSGGDELLFKFAMGWHPRPDLDLGFSVDLPLYEDFNGQQLGLDNRLQLSLGWRF
ncbi:MAG: transporter [bacterium]|nr:transporter [bacterium]